MAQENFRAVVVGYTDNVPIKTIQFPSNWHLSQARAKSVADILAAFTGPGAIIAEGRGEADPIASNATPEGREKNRRTEILVLADPEEELTGAGATSPPLEVDIRNMPANPAAGGVLP